VFDDRIFLFNALQDTLQLLGFVLSILDMVGQNVLTWAISRVVVRAEEGLGLNGGVQASLPFLTLVQNLSALLARIIILNLR
jgi:hypothetical protein